MNDRCRKCQIPVQYGAEVLANTRGKYTWKIYLTNIPDKYTWQIYLANIPDKYTWQIYLANTPDKYTWEIYLERVDTPFGQTKELAFQGFARTSKSWMRRCQSEGKNCDSSPWSLGTLESGIIQGRCSLLNVQIGWTIFTESAPLGLFSHRVAKKDELNFQLPRRASDWKKYFLVLVTKFAY